MLMRLKVLTPVASLLRFLDNLTLELILVATLMRHLVHVDRSVPNVDSSSGRFEGLLKRVGHRDLMKRSFDPRFRRLLTRLKRLAEPQERQEEPPIFLAKATSLCC